MIQCPKLFDHNLRSSLFWQRLKSAMRLIDFMMWMVIGHDDCDEDLEKHQQSWTSPRNPEHCCFAMVAFYIPTVHQNALVFQHDNALPHRSIILQQCFNQCEMPKLNWPTHRTSHQSSTPGIWLVAVYRILPTICNSCSFGESTAISVSSSTNTILTHCVTPYLKDWWRSYMLLVYCWHTSVYRNYKLCFY